MLTVGELNVSAISYIKTSQTHIVSLVMIEDNVVFIVLLFLTVSYIWRAMAIVSFPARNVSRVAKYWDA